MSLKSGNVAGTVIKRYADAYIVAGAIERVGAAIKAIGIAIAIVVAFISLAVAAQASSLLSLFIGLLTGGCIVLVLYLLGILVSAQGQILKATLDTAVYASPFLADVERARIMSLPFEVVPSSAADLVSDWTCSCGQQNPPTTPACLDCGLARGA